MSDADDAAERLRKALEEQRRKDREADAARRKATEDARRKAEKMHGQRKPGKGS